MLRPETLEPQTLWKLFRSTDQIWARLCQQPVKHRMAKLMCMSRFQVFLLLLLLLLLQCCFHQLLTVNDRRRWRLLAGCLCCCRLCRCQSFVVVGREYITEHKAISVDGLAHFDVNRPGEDRAVPRECVELAILWAANTPSSRTAAARQQQSVIVVVGTAGSASKFAATDAMLSCWPNASTQVCSAGPCPPQPVASDSRVVSCSLAAAWPRRKAATLVQLTSPHGSTPAGRSDSSA